MSARARARPWWRQCEVLGPGPGCRHVGADRHDWTELLQAWERAGVCPSDLPEEFQLRGRYVMRRSWAAGMAVLPRGRRVYECLSCGRQFRPRLLSPGPYHFRLLLVCGPVREVVAGPFRVRLGRVEAEIR